jgi:uncharacterized protein
MSTAGSGPVSCLYEGDVVHRRLRPKPHALTYRVFSILLDVDQIDATAGRLWLFSRNRWNAVSFHDGDHGAGVPGVSVAAHARATFRAADLAAATSQIYLLAYPRVFGFGFNPISVFYGYSPSGRLAGVIYEVNNTFGERRSYVVPILQSDAAKSDGVYAHGCKKELYVSPFTDMAGRYGFRLREPTEHVLVGVNLRDDDGPLLRTHFRATRISLTDRHVLRLLVMRPLMTAKVVLAIHLEAVKLWFKGVPLTSRSKTTPYAVTHVAQVTDL